MKVHGGAPFWLVRNGLAPARPSLRQSTVCDVVVWGAGITGALVADRLAREGLDVIVLDRRESGVASTAASTALIQYDVDIELVQLADKIGARDAARAYLASANAVRELAALCDELESVDFQPRGSLYLASSRRDATRLRREVDARAAIGLDVTWSPAPTVARETGLPSHGAVQSALGGEVDALALTRALLGRAETRGARWFEQTHVSGYEERGAALRVRTRSGPTIDTRHLICATGYQVPSYFALQLPTALHSTFALATERVASFGAWDDRRLIWESARPYCYMRTTADRRVLIGGEDVPFTNTVARDLLLRHKARRLETRLREWLPGVRTETAYTWAGTFAETPDGLPYIGSTDRHPGVLFALGYGGNGITFSVIAAGVLAARCLGATSECADLFALDR